MGVWKSHPWCEAIIAGSLSSCPPSATSFQPITPQRCLSSPFHYSHLSGQKIRVTLGGPLSSPRPFSRSPSTFPSFYFSPITPSSLVGIWRVTLGQFNLSSPSATQPSWVPQPSHLWPYPSSGLSLCFLHFTPPLPSCATQDFLFPHLSLLFSISLSFFLAYLWLLSPQCLWEGVSRWPCCAGIVKCITVQLHQLK